MKNKLKKLKDYQLIEIEWEDSTHTSGNGWLVQDEVNIPEDLTIFTTGYLFGFTNKHVSVVQSRAIDERCFDAIMTIPFIAIKNIKAVKL